MVGKNDAWKYAHLDTTEATMTTTDRGAEDARNVVLAIKQRMRGIGPGFAVTIAARPGEWQALLDSIPGPADAASPASGGETSSVEYQQRRGVAWDIIEQAINTYDSWMLDDDYEANRVLKEIVEQMRARRSLYMPHEREAASPAPAVTEEEIARITCEKINRPFTDRPACCLANIANGEKCNNRLNWAEATEVARAVLAMIRGHRWTPTT